MIFKKKPKNRVASPPRGSEASSEFSENASFAARHFLHAMAICYTPVVHLPNIARASLSHTNSMGEVC